ncbi:hypothetical protein V3C99_001209 [Haemonchus contortus]
MSRHDRDKYVFVNLANIEEKWRSQFAWQREEDNDNFNLGYDYGSIMHSPENTEIEIEIVSFSKYHAIEGCPNAGVEIKTNENHQLTGYRFCSASAAGTKLRSFTNRVPIITWNKVSESRVVLRYRQVSKDEPRSTTLGSETRRITQPPTTFAPPPPVQKNKCEDRPECPIHIANGFCYRKGITYEQRKTYCPRGCHLCGSRGF